MMDQILRDLVSPPCPLCGGREFARLAGNDRYGMKLQTAGCRNCGLAQTWPRPSPDAMSQFYRNHYREYYQASSIPNADYVARFHKDERLRYTARAITSNVQLRPGMRVLDIGCAEGTLLSHLLAECPGLVPVGIEPSENFARYARQSTGCTTFPDLGALIAAGEGDFDLVIVNHVLEHVDDPVVFLSTVKDLLRSGAYVYIDVPDVETYASPQMLHIAHLFHFSERTLLATLKAAGFGSAAATRHVPPHHPKSIRCLAQIEGESLKEVKLEALSEREAWNRVVHAGRQIPLYLLKARLRRLPLVAVTWEWVRALRGRAFS